MPDDEPLDKKSIPTTVPFGQTEFNLPNIPYQPLEKKYKRYLRKLKTNEQLEFKIKTRPLVFLIVALAFFFTLAGFLLNKSLSNTPYVATSGEVTLQGVVKKTEVNNYFLSMPGYKMYKLKTNRSVNFETYLNKNVLITGKVEKNSNVIDASMIEGF